MKAYEDFLAAKAKLDPPTGLTDLPELPFQLFPHQRDIVRWALRRGRAAIFANTGLGKSFMELAWGKAVHDVTGGNVLLLTPLAVAGQMVREAGKFGLAAKQCASQDEVEPGVTVTNYAKLHHFDLSQFVGVILDESSILKAFDGKTRNLLVESCAQVPYRLAATATPAPNDFTELGNHAEFLGVMSLTGMQSVFFTHDNGDTGKWRLKGHAEDDFWRWMCSWSVLLRRPSDLGYDDGAYDLPELIQEEHLVPVEGPVAKTLSERLRARRDSLEQRVAKAVEIIKEYDQWENHAPNTGESTTPQTGKSDGQTSGLPTDGTLKLDRLQTGDGKSLPIQKCCEPGIGSTTPQTSTATSSEAPNSISSNTASTRNPSLECLRPRADAAPSAESSLLTSGDSISTTAIEAGAFGESSATPATCSSGDSMTTSDGSTNMGTPLQRPTWSGPKRPWVVWTNLNDESSALAAAIPGAVEIRGSDKEERKEEILRDFAEGRIRVLITKPSLTGFGLNWQHCADTIFVGLNDSFEQVYQAVRRFWRFGQTRPVTVHFVAASTEGAVLENLRRKEADAERMGAAMVANMADLSSELVHGALREEDPYTPTVPVDLPFWLTQGE